MLLQVENINTFYGLSQVLFDVSLEIDKGEVVVLLGRNGAGKTTTMISIMGLNPPKRGRVTFKGREITGDDKIKQLVALDIDADKFSPFGIFPNRSDGQAVRGIGHHPHDPQTG